MDKTEKSDIEYEADKLQDVLNSLNYQETIGKWIEEIWEKAIEIMSSSQDPVQVEMARAELRVIRTLRSRMENTIKRATVRTAKREREVKKKQLQQGIPI